MTSTPISLLRALFRESYKINDYNFRMYAIRRVKSGFVSSKDISGDEAASAIKDGYKQLELLQRQRSLGNMYPSSKSVME